MKKQILLTFFLFPLLMSAQLVVEKQNHTIEEWLKTDSISILIGLDGKIPDENLDYFGDFQVIGWSESGLLAYTYYPTIVIACESAELSFYIYDLVNNKQVAQAHACSSDWKEMDDASVKEILTQLEEHEIKIADNKELVSINTRIEKTDSLINIYYSNADEELLLSTLEFNNSYFVMHEAEGYITSPFNENLKVIIFPRDILDYGEVFVFGLEHK